MVAANFSNKRDPLGYLANSPVSINLANMERIYTKSGQIIATSHDLTPNGGLVREIPLFQGNLGWWNIIIWPDQMHFQSEQFQSPAMLTRG